MIIEAAIQEDVDVIGISVLSGAHMTIFPRILTLMKEKDMEDVLLTGGGIIPEVDINILKKQGVGELFTPGATTTSIADFIKSWITSHPRS
jgi:methylmalonyl-CoA mutase C-terminal domain/subunit